MDSELKLSSADGLELKLEIAALGSRSYAFIIDWHFRVLLCLAWLLAAWILMKISGDTNFSELTAESGQRLQATLVFLPPLLIYLLYHPVLETLMQGRTPGKRFAGLRLVTTRGNTPTFSAIIIRNLFRLVDSLPMLYVLGCAACIISRQKCRIGDMAAGTLLVYENTVDRKALKNAQILAQQSELTPGNQTLLLDILARWKTLDKASRVRIGRAFLLSIKEEISTADTSSTEEEVLHEKLIMLAGGENYEH